MKIETKAKLILTVPNPKENDSAAEIVLAAEQAFNQMAYFVVPKTETTVGVRIHISGKEPKVTK